MAGGLWRALRRFVLWDYERATWQYDLMVALILAFVFLTPRGWFRDQPRVPRPSRIVMLPSAHGEVLYWIEAETLAGVAPAEHTRKVSEMLKSGDGKPPQVTSVEAVVDSENEVRGYLALTKP